MKTKQENRFTMHKVVKKFADENAAALAVNPDLVLAFGLLGDQITLTAGLVQTQNLDRTGVASAKNIAREIMEERGMGIAGRIASWAYLHQNPVLEAEMNFTKYGKTASTGISRLSDTEVALTCRTILQRATDNLANIASITALELTGFEGFIATYENLLSAPATSEGLAVVATAQLEPTLDRTDEILRKACDRGMLAFSHSSPTLLALYQQARIVIDLGTRHEPDEPTPPAPAPTPTPTPTP